MKNGIRIEEVGVLSVDAGDVVCFSMDSVLKIAKKFGRGFGNKSLKDVHDQNQDLEKFIKELGGVACQFGSDGGYAVNKVSIVSPNGATYPGVLIGGPEGEIRLLEQGIPSYEEAVPTLDPDWKEKSDKYAKMLVRKVWEG